MKDSTKEILIIAAFAATTLTVLIVAAFVKTDSKKDDIINAYREYFNRTEQMIDFNAQYSEDFLDITAETDYYQDYQDAREKIWTLER